MKLFRVIRAVEWWEYKFPPILAGAYFILPGPFITFSSIGSMVGFMICSLITGAVYVSVLNDVTDIQDDAHAGKQNRMASYGPAARIFFAGLALLAGAICCWFLRAYPTSLILYMAGYLAFTLYSLPPFRLKKRGIAGIFSDAAGSQLFPTLYACTLAAVYCSVALSWLEFLMLGTWSFCFGLRGILWHQFHDLENDIKSGIHTWVQTLSPRKTRFLGRCILVPEMIAILWLIIHFGQYACLFSLLLYLFYLFMWRKKTGVQIIMFRQHQMHFTIFMNEYYQVFLPLTILATLSVAYSSFIYLLILHLLIFPMGPFRISRNAMTLLQTPKTNP